MFTLWQSYEILAPQWQYIVALCQGMTDKNTHTEYNIVCIYYHVYIYL